MAQKKFDLLTLTQVAKAAGTSLTTARRAVKKGLWKPDAKSSASFLFLLSRVRELKRLIVNKPAKTTHAPSTKL